MKYALVNPNWSFDGSIYFGCRAPHLPLELGYSQALLEQAGHEALLVDAALEGLDSGELRRRVQDFAPDFTVVPTAPSYLFWRCPPPELRVPQETLALLGEAAGRTVIVGPHASTTPRATLSKLGADAAVLGECEATLPRLALEDWGAIEGLAWREGEALRVQGAPQMVDLATLPALHWPSTLIRRHEHHHHRFDEPQHGLGAEVEASRGCPYSCSFCAKTDHRDGFRWRPLEVLLEEIDALVEQGVGYLYFIDEIFMPKRELLEALVERPVQFGIQTRIDLWKPELLDLLGRAGCVSIEAGVESISQAGRDALNKNCRVSTDELRERLLHARHTVPFVQASLLDSQADDRAAVEAWRQELIAHGVWANKPVPMFPYPGSPDYVRLWGLPDEGAWERAVDYYLENFVEFSDIQDGAPRRVRELERSGAAR